ncbi:MAG TPA: DUF2807 domain-containing protein [Puia sp.]|nr:DUF2807 domain-containing protein [Puia sp.]
MNHSILILLFSLFSLDETNNTTSIRPLSGQTIPIDTPFNSVTIYNDVNLYITEGARNEIIVENQETADAVRFQVKDKTLLIHSRTVFFHRSIRGKIIICVQNINCISIVGDAEVRTIGSLSDRSLKLEIFGDGAIYANTTALEVNTFMKGLGKIEVKGNFKNTTVNKDAYGNIVTIYN